MSSENKKVTREFRVTVTVEEVDAPKIGDIPVVASQDSFSREAKEFFDEEDYSSPK